MADLVAGGAGFIGSHLCRRLLDEDRTVICLDSLITGRRSNIEALLAGPRFAFVEADVSVEIQFSEQVERIFHLASPASPPAYERYPLDTLRANGEGTRQLLELATAEGARFLYASSSEVYGDPLEHPQREDSRAATNPVGPRSMYHEAKRYGEALTIAYVRTRGVDGRIARIFNTYGPRMDPGDGRLLPSFIGQALRGEPLTVHGLGSQTRSLCYVSDLVEGLLRLMESPEARGEAVNLGNPDEHSVLEYAEIVRALTGSASGIEFLPHPTGEDPRRRCPEITKAQRLLDWKPAIGLKEGLIDTVEYFRAEAAAVVPSGSG